MLAEAVSDIQSLQTALQSKQQDIESIQSKMSSNETLLKDLTDQIESSRSLRSSLLRQAASNRELISVNGDLLCIVKSVADICHVYEGTSNMTRRIKSVLGNGKNAGSDIAWLDFKSVQRTSFNE